MLCAKLVNHRICRFKDRLLYMKRCYTKPYFKRKRDLMTKEQKWNVGIGIIGIILTALSILNSYWIFQFQSKSADAELAIARQNTDASAIQVFHAFLPALRKGDEKAQETFGFIAERFKKEHDNTLFAELILHLESQNEITLEARTVLQLSEATAPATSGNWIAVVHSYQAENQDRAQRGACRIIQDLNTKWPEEMTRPKVEVYLTKISNNLAVTVGGFVSEDEAKQTAARLRNLGIKNDAFAQVNRDWVQTEIKGETLLQVQCRS